MAFHPTYPDDDRVFVRYSAPSRSNTPEEYSHVRPLLVQDGCRRRDGRP